MMNGVIMTLKENYPNEDISSITEPTTLMSRTQKMICGAGQAGRGDKAALPCHTPPMNRKLQGTVHAVI
jgi:hypothetical protein